MKNIIKSALANSLVTTAYVSTVASFLFFAGQAKLGGNNMVKEDLDSLRHLFQLG